MGPHALSYVCEKVIREGAKFRPKSHEVGPT